MLSWKWPGYGSWDTCMYESLCVCVWCVCVCVCAGSRVVNNVRFELIEAPLPFQWLCLYTALVSLPASLSAHPVSLSFLYTSPQLYTFTLYLSAERSSPALIQLGFIKPDHWRIRVMRFLLCVRNTELVFAFMWGLRK